MAPATKTKRYLVATSVSCMAVEFSLCALERKNRSKYSRHPLQDRVRRVGLSSYERREPRLVACHCVAPTLARRCELKGNATTVRVPNNVRTLHFQMSQQRSTVQRFLSNSCPPAAATACVTTPTVGDEPIATREAGLGRKWAEGVGDERPVDAQHGFASASDLVLQADTTEVGSFHTSCSSVGAGVILVMQVGAEMVYPSMLEPPAPIPKQRHATIAGS